MSNFQDFYFGEKNKNQSVISEAGTDLILKCTVPRLLSQKYFPMLKAKNFNIEMEGPEEEASASIRLTNIQDLVNVMKEIQRDVVFRKNGDILVIMENSPIKD